MTFFGFVGLIAIAWCFLQGDITPGNLILGGGLGTAVLSISLSINKLTGSFNQLKAIVRLIGFVIKELIISSLRISWDILTPTVYARPRIVRIPIEDLDETAITVLANAISLTPGSLSLEVTDDLKILYVHLMYAEDRDSAVREIYFELGNRVRAACGISEIER